DDLRTDPGAQIDGTVERWSLQLPERDHAALADRFEEQSRQMGLSMVSDGGQGRAEFLEPVEGGRGAGDVEVAPEGRDDEPLWLRIEGHGALPRVEEAADVLERHHVALFGRGLFGAERAARDLGFGVFEGPLQA